MGFHEDHSWKVAITNDSRTVDTYLNAKVTG
jgi:hypothetical protein